LKLFIESASLVMKDLVYEAKAKAKTFSQGQCQGHKNFSWPKSRPTETVTIKS